MSRVTFEEQIRPGVSAFHFHPWPLIRVGASSPVYPVDQLSPDVLTSAGIAASRVFRDAECVETVTVFRRRIEVTKKTGTSVAQLHAVGEKAGSEWMRKALLYKKF